MKKTLSYLGYLNLVKLVAALINNSFNGLNSSTLFASHKNVFYPWHSKFQGRVNNATEAYSIFRGKYVGRVQRLKPISQVKS